MENTRDKKGRFINGHRYSVKWNKKNTIAKLQEIIELINNNPNICTLMDAADESNMYMNWFRYIQDKFIENDEIYELVEKIYTKLERRSYNRTANGDINPYLGLFTLKAYHNRVEKQFVQTENENTNHNSFSEPLSLNIIYPKKDIE